jgi:hypothetical protein
MAGVAVDLRLADRTFLEKRIKELASDSKNIVFDHPHFQLRLKSRNLTMRHILETIRTGSIIDGPSKDKWGDWRAKVARLVAGRRVQVVLAYKGDHLVVVTAI